MKKTIRIALAILLVLLLALALTACNPCANGNHKWDDGEVVKPATCDRAGVKIFKCQLCDKAKEEMIPATGVHLNVEKHEAQAHDECRSDGNVEYYECHDCGKLFSDEKCEREITREETVDPAEKHSLTIHHDEQQPDCATDGVKEYWECDRCGALFSDANGRKKISDPIVIPALKHRLVPNEEFGDHGFVWNDDYTSVVFHLYCLEGDATFEVDLSDRITVIDIEECGKPSRTVYYVIFDVNWTDLIDGNKIADGIKNPMDSFIEIVHEDLMNGHVLALTKDEWTWSIESEVSITLYFECEQCEEKVSKAITSGITVITEPATCMDAGSTTYKFNLSKSALAELLGYDTLAESVPNTFTATKEDRGSALGDHVFDQQIAATPATCGTNGEIAHNHCQACNKWYNEAKEEIQDGDWTIPATGLHDFSGSWKKVDETNHKTICVTCNVAEQTAKHTWSDTALEDDEDNHTFICEATGCDATKTEAHTLKRSNDGDDDYHWIECEYCDYSDLEEHDFGSGEARHDCDCGEPICKETTSNADVTYKHAASSSNVALNGVTIDVENVVSLVFTTYNGGSNAPQYNKSGYIQFYGGNQLTISWKGFEVTKIEFTFTSGKAGAIQVVSGGGKYSVSGTLGTWTADENVSTAPIVLQNGTGSSQGQAQITQIKIYCSATVMVGHHVWKDGETIPATCTEPEYLQQTCKRCGATQTVETGEPATGHRFGALTPAQDETCGVDGNIAYKQCTVCNKYFDENDKELQQDEWIRKATGEHTLGEWYTEDTEGHYHKCTVCDKQIEESKTPHVYELTNLNDEQHANVCVCGAIEAGSLKNHEYTDGSKCACGAEKDHVHSYDLGKTKHDETGHWQVCDTCDYEDKENKSSHTYVKQTDYVSVTLGKHSANCDVCDYVATHANTYAITETGHKITCVLGCAIDVSEDHDYNSGDDGCICGAEKPAAPVWTLATSDTTFAVGDQIIIVSNTTALGQSSTTSTVYRIAVKNGIKINEDGTATIIDDNVAVITLQAGNSAGSFALQIGDVYLTWSSGNSLPNANSVTNSSSWTINIKEASANTFNIANVATNTRYIDYNNDRFAAYSNRQTAPQIYKLSGSSSGGGEVDPTPDPEHVCESVCDDCGYCTNLSCSEEACLTKCEGNHNSSGGDTEKTEHTVTIIFGDIASEKGWTGTSTNLTGTSISIDGVQIEFADGTGFSTKIQYYANNKDLRVYNKNTVTITVPSDGTITKVEFTPTGTSNKGSFTANVGTYSSSTCIWEYSDGVQQLILTQGSTQLRATAITITYYA